MDEHFTCSECSGVIEAPDDWRGKRIKCPYCEAKLRLPAEGSVASPDQEEVRRPAGARAELLDDEGYESQEQTGYAYEERPDDPYQAYWDAVRRHPPFPFEDRNASFPERFSSTLKGSLLDPRDTFIYTEGRTTFRSALMFLALCLLLAFVVGLVSQTVLDPYEIAMLNIESMIDSMRDLGVPEKFIEGFESEVYKNMESQSLESTIVLGLLGIPLLILFFLFAGVIVHVCASIWGCAQSGFETTMVVCCYVFGACWVLMAVVNLVGSVIGLITLESAPGIYTMYSMLATLGLTVVLAISLSIALASAHFSSAFRAFGAVVTPVLACCFCCCAGSFLLGMAIGGGM